MTRQRSRSICTVLIRSVAVFAFLIAFVGSGQSQNPVPLMNQPLVPDAASPGGAGFTLTVNGAGFVAASVVNWSGSPRPTTFVSGTQLTAAIPASDTATASTAAITVVTPSPGGGVSNTLYFSTSVPEASLSFQTPTTYASGNGDPYFLAVADVNGDGKPDLLVAEGQGVGVMLGNADGTFQPPASYATGGYQTVSVVVADVNGDGKLDLVVANSISLTVGVILGNGDGTFQRAVTYPAGGSPWSVAVADVNGDGKPDIIVGDESSCYACSGDGLVGVLLGNGDGTFQPVVTYKSGGDSFETSPTALAVADLNGDGKVDIAMTNYCRSSCSASAEGEVSVLLGKGNGTFQAAVSYDSGGEGLSIGAIAIADVNGDGKPDLLISNGNSVSGGVSGPGAIGVLLGNGDGSFQPAVLYGSGAYSATSVTVGDVDSDGKPDLVVTNFCSPTGCTNPRGPGTIGVLKGNGDGTFQTAVTYNAGGTWGAFSTVVADVDGDGRPDLIVADFVDLTGRPVDVFLNSTIAANPTTTTLSTAPNPSVYGEAVTFTATVTSSSGTPTGTVNLLNGSTVVGTGTLAGGMTSIRVSSLPAGADSITAKYLGSTTFASSTSTPLTQTVTVATTSTSLASSLNPAATSQSVTFTATVASQFGGAATGSVVFSSGSQTLGAVSLSANIAALTTSFSGAGTYSITAKYKGDGNNSGSTSSTLSEVVKAATATTLVSSLNPSVVGQAVTFTAGVSSTAGTPPNGETITFKNGSAVLGTATLNGGIAALTTSSLPAGIFIITASYPGDANFAASTSPGLRQVVNSTTKSATATTLVSSLNPSIYGQKVTWTATVTTSGSVAPTGTVKFIWSGHSIGTATLNASGVATLTRSNLNADTYPLTAVYTGDASNQGSTSGVVSQVVTRATSSATLTSSPNPSTSGQAVTFTATITSPTVTPTGPVTFAVGTTVLGTAQLSGGKAKFTTSTLAVGSTKVTATYYGDSNIAKSSASVTQTVQ